ncbi:pentatricopeptide repeat-containing protein DOT4, chloroplastic-like [Neltuma alba]|uniref:pentatricopeptide repeat-containing protein DOT4, chloroplastic-like n=1 Tax=Neltuma alba TaxID=207710 RepID=UPI0010A4D2D4|nr:pentatricopeptide repeat-containing protein DOT4, chloroplastic-like [Prosopis alba]
MDILQSATVLCFASQQKPMTTVQVRRPRNLRCCGGPFVAPRGLTRQLFDEIPIWDTFAWNNLIQTHLSNGDFDSVLSTYDQMLLRGVHPDRHTLPRVVAATRLLGDLSIGRQVHGQALKLGFSSDQYAITALIEMYGHLDSVEMAKLIFDKSPHRNLVSWTLLARLYIDQGKPSSTLDLFHQMVDLGVPIDPVALATATSACGLLKSLQKGKLLHEIAKKFGLEFDVLVSNSLVKMYIDCGSLKDARLMFDQMTFKDVISWTLVIRSYVRIGEFNEGLKLFRRMNWNGLKPDSLSVASILPACGRIASHKHGKEIHGYLLRSGIQLNLKLKNALMDMYVKSGAIACASNIFAELNEKDVITWTVMILGYSLHGQGKLGVDVFCRMEKNSKAHLDKTTYAAVLHACSTARLVEEGKFYFNRVRSPTVAHYALMVALLARAGLFNEAMAFIKEHNIGKHAEVQRKLLEGCRIHRQHTLGKRVVEQLCDLEPLNADNYVLLLNWYAGNAKWHMVDKLRETIRDMGLKPRKAYSWIVFRNKVHVFGTGDVSHPRSAGIYSELQRFVEEMSIQGIEPAWDFNLHDVDEERECIPIGHSELLAISFGLVSSRAGPIRVTKNLTVCHGCHDFAKFVSKTTGREIILKDPNLFHHFRDGFCSCGDLW